MAEDTEKDTEDHDKKERASRVLQPGILGWSNNPDGTRNVWTTGVIVLPIKEKTTEETISKDEKEEPKNPSE